MDEERARGERALAERLAAGDEQALEVIYDAYSRAVYRQALMLLGSAADAEDVLQEVFLKLVRRRGSPVRDLTAYLLTAARHEACSILRRRGRETWDGTLEETDLAPVDAHADFAETDAVRAAVAALPESQRQVVILKFYDQMTFAEIARVARASINTVASRYRYALKRLREALGDVADVP
jgi:RNA polymerase sigma-70 factor, ECF subfamily